MVKERAKLNSKNTSGETNTPERLPLGQLVFLPNLGIERDVLIAPWSQGKAG